MIPRAIAKNFQQIRTKYPVVTVLGPRQSGKSTLVQHLCSDMAYVNLEQPDLRKVIAEDPLSFFEKHPNGVVIDEVQRIPELLSYIQVIVDKQENQSKKGMFILTGSHQLDLHESITQSLAGRTSTLKLYPLTINELLSVGTKSSLYDFMLNGFYPRLYNDNLDPSRMFADYLETYVQRDVRKIINIKDLGQFQDFLHLCAGRIGQLINYNSLSNDLGVSSATIKQWISILEASFVTVRLRPYFENIGKRMVKSPKLYFVDVGLACYLLGIETLEQLMTHPLRGNLFENLVVLELMKSRFNDGKDPNMYYFRDSNRNEVDVIFKCADELIPIEIKSSKTFSLSFLKGLKYFTGVLPQRVNTGYVVYAGDIQQKIEMYEIVNFVNSYKIVCPIAPEIDLS